MNKAHRLYVFSSLQVVHIWLASFPGLKRWEEEKGPGFSCLHMHLIVVKFHRLRHLWYYTLHCQ